MSPGPRDAALSSPVFSTALSPAPPPMVPGSLRRAAGILGELLALVGIVYCFPFVILAIGIPIALCLRLLLWLGGLL